jgi:hypothetical protein
VFIRREIGLLIIGLLAVLGFSACCPTYDCDVENRFISVAFQTNTLDSADFGLNEIDTITVIRKRVSGVRPDTSYWYFSGTAYTQTVGSTQYKNMLIDMYPSTDSVKFILNSGEQFILSDRILVWKEKKSITGCKECPELNQNAIKFEGLYYPITVNSSLKNSRMKTEFGVVKFRKI